MLAVNIYVHPRNPSEGKGKPTPLWSLPAPSLTHPRGFLIQQATRLPAPDPSLLRKVI